MGLEPDLLTVGKSIAGGVPLGAYGMTDDVAKVLRPPPDGASVSGIAYDEVATGGTLFANALSMAAARAALTEVLTQEAFATTARLGGKLAAGLHAHIDQAGLPWSVNAHGSHACYFFSPQPPRDARGARDADDPALRALIRLFLGPRPIGREVRVDLEARDRFRQLVEFVYRVRCNLFHGQETPSAERDQALVVLCGGVVGAWLASLMSGWHGANLHPRTLMRRGRLCGCRLACSYTQ